MPNPEAVALSLPVIVDGTSVQKTFELKDAAAREATVGGVHFVGETSTVLSDGSTASSIYIGDPATAYSPKNGDIVAYGNKEFIYVKIGSGTGSWKEFGDLTGLGSLATQDSASHVDFVPEGDVDDFDVALSVEEGAYVISDITSDVGSVSAGIADVLSMSVVSNTLQISWTAGTPTSVTLPSFTQQDIAYGVSSVTQPTFSASAQTITAE